MKKKELSLEEIYPKPDKYKLILENDNLYEMWEKSIKYVEENFFNNNIKNKDILIKFIALEIIDIDNINKKNEKKLVIKENLLDLLKDYNNVLNEWLKWSLANDRDIKDFNLIASGIDVFNGSEFDKFVKHKFQFAKKNNIDLTKQDLDIMYYKLYQFYKDLEYSGFDKEYNFFKDIPENIKKIIYKKNINSIEELNFYKDIIEINKNGFMDIKSTIFLLNIPYKYINNFNKYEVDLKKLLDNRMFSSQEYVYKLIEYSTKDESLMLFLKGLSKVGIGMFEKNIDPRVDVEDQFANTYVDNGQSINFDKDNKPYMIDDDDYKMRIFDDVNLALEKFHNDYIKAKNSDKFTFKNSDFEFSLKKLNVPYLSGEVDGYKFETHAALTKSLINGEEIFNGEFLTEGFKRNDCTNPFKSNYVMGWEMVELISLHPEDNVYVILKDTNNKEIASMFVSKVNNDLIVDSIQYIKDLNLVKNNISDDIENHYHTKIHDLVTMWSTEIVLNHKIDTIFFGNGGNGDNPRLRLTNKVANKFGQIIPDKSLNGKLEYFLATPQHPHTGTATLDYEGSVDDGVARVLMSKNPRYLNYKDIRETILDNLKNLPKSYDGRKKMIDLVENVSTNYKEYNKIRKNQGLDKFEFQEGILADYDTYSKEYKEREFGNSDFDIS